ncbi:nuclear transport factor 2 family protein [Nocardia rhamnosiphila]
MGENSNRVADLLAAYISVWNERNPHIRQAIGTEVLTPEAYYVDPSTSAQGRSAIDTYIAGWQRQFPDSSFVLGEVCGHHDVVHFDWSFGPSDGPPQGTGRDVAVLEQGRISTIYGFFC